MQAAERLQPPARAAQWVLARRWCVCLAVCLMLLAAPALWNGFPLLQWDTGGYLARWYEGTLVESRSTIYGLMLYLLAGGDFWPVVLLQSALAAWVIALVMRAHGLNRPEQLAIAIALLCCVTSLPWLTALLLTDIFSGLAVLAVYLLALEPETLRRSERWGLVLVIAVGVATHSGTLAVVLLLTGALAVASVGIAAAGCRVDVRGLLLCAGSIALGAAMLVAGNWAVSGRLAWTPGGYGIVFARMVEDGIAKHYLDENCHGAKLRLCKYRNELPPTADDFLWGGRKSPFDRLGGFAGLDEEMRSIVIDSLVKYPVAHLQAAVVATARQMFTVSTGEGVGDALAHTYGIIERFTPGAAPGMRSARQQTGDLKVFDRLNAIHVPIALGCAVAVLAMLGLAVSRRRFTSLDRLAAAIAVAFLANAAVCAIISNPHPRYGARLAWLAPLLITVLLLRQLQALSSGDRVDPPLRGRAY